jgi:hypothetical protein
MMKKLSLLICAGITISCGPSKEELIQEILASPEFAEAVQQSAGNNEKVENLTEMAECLSKVSMAANYDRWKRSASKSGVRKCGKKGMGEE